ncbi:hypothetical protein HA075_07090 [bacterium BFN5]|nr:hypothetical protein HA075_07055 [bacterium BFN5]QJW45632.1 hypothetical protein HA075_07090 [bacterium BFN5]
MMSVKQFCGIALITMLTMSSAVVMANGESVLQHELLDKKEIPIQVQAVDNISSQKNHLHDKVLFRVMKDLCIDDTVSIPAHSVVAAEITQIKRAALWDKDGEVEVTFSDLSTQEGEVLPVMGKIHRGGSKQNILVKYSLGGILIKGKPAVIQAGEVVELQLVDASKFRMQAADKVLK